MLATTAPTQNAVKTAFLWQTVVPSLVWRCFRLPERAPQLQARARPNLRLQLRLRLHPNLRVRLRLRPHPDLRVPALPRPRHGRRVAPSSPPPPSRQLPPLPPPPPDRQRLLSVAAWVRAIQLHSRSALWEP